METRPVGIVLIGLGLALVIAGISVWSGWSLPGGLRPGRLPGDLTFRRGNSSVSILLGTSLLLSVILTVILAMFRR